MDLDTSPIQDSNDLIAAGSLCKDDSSESQTKVLAASSNYPDPLQKSSSPYQQNSSLVGESNSISPSDDTNRLVGPAQKAPGRTVFDDLETAHSSITSGRPGRRVASQNSPDDYSGQENSIPLQDLEPSSSIDDSALLENLPLPLLPAVLSEGRHLRERDAGHWLRGNMTSSSSAEPSPPINSDEPKSLYATVKTAFIPVSSPTARDGTSEHAHRHRSIGRGIVVGAAGHCTGDHEENSSTPCPAPSQAKASEGSALTSNGAHSREENSTYPSSQVVPHSGSVYPNASKEHDTVGSQASAPAKRTTLPSKHLNFQSGITDGSLPEGSTVGNIYQHYATHGILDDDGEEDDSNLYKNFPDVPPIQPMFPKSSFRPPSMARESEPRPLPLPAIPRSDRQYLLSTAQEVVPSSSYEDTSSTLEESQQFDLERYKGRISRSAACVDLSDRAISEVGSLPQIIPRRLKPNNPYRLSQGRICASSISEAGNSANRSRSNNEDTRSVRRPLERVVSQELRRVSALSYGSISSSILFPEGGYGAMAIQDRGISKGKEVDNTPPADRESIDSETRVLVASTARAEAYFFDHDAIDDNWVSYRARRLGVRVPISHDGAMPASPPTSPRHPVRQPAESSRPQEDSEGTDWETIGGSAFNLDNRNGKHVGYIGGGIHRTGSSIANTSDEGSLGDGIREIDDFGSTERIAQHPSRINYYGDYRMKDLKNTKTPCLLPVYTDHKVNGLPSDSTRLRPRPTPYFEAPRPLPRAHQHPFNSSPPEVMESPQARNRRDIPRAGGRRKTNHFPSEMSLKRREDKTADEYIENMAHPSRSSRRDQAALEDRPWPADYGRSGATIDNHTRQFLGVRESDRPNSYSHVLAFANGDGVPGWNADGTRTFDTESSGNESTLGNSQFGSASTGLQIHRNLPQNSNRGGERRTILRQPPGSFYRQIRIVSDKRKGDAARDAHRDQQARRQLGQEQVNPQLPTNTLRPISLLGQQPATPNRHTVDGDVGPNGFVYRSPLAPPKRASTLGLYTAEQRRAMEEAAVRDGFRTSRGYEAIGTSNLHLYEPPRMASSRMSAGSESIVARQNNISTVVLCLCVLFPPLLILYAFGKLDGLIIWVTNGELWDFSKYHKRLAFVLSCFFILLVVVGIVGFLIAWFTGLRNHA